MRPPGACRAASANAVSRLCASVTSALSATTPPAPPSASKPRRAPGSRPSANTRTPRRASSPQSAAPIPELQPVTTAAPAPPPPLPRRAPPPRPRRSPPMPNPRPARSFS